MAYLTQFYTNTLNDQNINTALLIGTITNATRIRKFWINVFLDNVAGGATGDYYAYVTWQRAGAGNFHESLKTSKPAAVGTTAIVFNTITLTTSTATDVIRVYVLGLAGDNVGAVDATVDVNEEWLNIDANGRVDVGAWLGVVPAVLTASGYVQAMLLRWLTDNAAGTPSALSSNLVQVADSAGVTTLLGRISATLFSGITSLANWLRLMSRKDAALAADAVAAQAEINANLGSGAGAMTNTTDSEEAIRDQINTLAPGAPINLTVDETDIVVNP